MLAGFVDGRGRAYDIGFRTLRFSLTDADGLLATVADEEVRVQGAAIASMDLMEAKPIPLLLPVRGELAATGRRVVFLAIAGPPRPDTLTFYNVSLSVHRTAIEHFFTVQGGREFVQFEKGDIEGRSPSGPGVDIVLRGPRPGAVNETSRHRLRLEPRPLAEEALGALG